MSTSNHQPAQEAPSQAATLGSAAFGRNSPSEEDATGESKKNSGGSYPAGFVLAEAPAHASKDELLQLAADRDGWHREVLESIHPWCPTVAIWAKSKLPLISLSAEKWLEGATKVNGQFSGGHVKWAPETTKVEVEK